MPEIKVKLAEALVIAGVLSFIFTIYFLAYVAWITLGLPIDLYLNPWMAAFGVLTLTFGVSISIWIFRMFSPRSILRSTAYTVLWFTRRGKTTPVKRGPLITSGPYAYMRHPIYFVVWLITLSLGLLFGFPLITSVFLLFWFNLIIHFEEKELCEIYGHEYEEYRRRVPRFIPWRVFVRKQV
jgi:protein-S-isoprenylcysteine O-methyltransferase Ste14